MCSAKETACLQMLKTAHQCHLVCLKACVTLNYFLNTHCILTGCCDWSYRRAKWSTMQHLCSRCIRSMLLRTTGSWWWTCAVGTMVRLLGTLLWKTLEETQERKWTRCYIMYLPTSIIHPSVLVWTWQPTKKNVHSSYDCFLKTSRLLLPIIGSLTPLFFLPVGISESLVMKLFICNHFFLHFQLLMQSSLKFMWFHYFNHNRIESKQFFKKMISPLVAILYSSEADCSWGCTAPFIQRSHTHFFMSVEFLLAVLQLIVQKPPKEICPASDCGWTNSFEPKPCHSA